jgi:hypothetical protein
MVGTEKRVRLGLAFGSLAAGCVWLATTGNALAPVLIVFGVLLILSEWMLGGNGFIALSSGAAGEDAEIDAATVLKRRLGRDAAVLRNLLVPNPMSSVGSTEADVVVVTDAGVFVFEVKSHRDVVVADPKADGWPVSWRGKGSVVRNPVRQVAGQVRAIRAYLAGKGLNTPVHAAVYMPNAEVRKIGHLSVPVFTSRQFLTPFVKAKDGEKVAGSGKLVAEALRLRAVDAPGRA